MPRRQVCRGEKNRVRCRVAAYPVGPWESPAGEAVPHPAEDMGEAS